AAAADEQAGNTDQQPIGPWQCVRLIELPMSESGPSKFEAVFEADPGYDQMVANNRSPAFTLIHGPGKVLIVDGVGGEAGAILPAALAKRNIDHEVVGVSGVPPTLPEMQRY